MMIADNGKEGQQAHSILDTALVYLAAGRSVLPIAPGSKKPSTVNAATGEIKPLTWKRYQSQRPPEAQVRHWFRPPTLMGLGVACGPVSGVQADSAQYALEVLDVDDAETLDQFVEAANWQGLGELLARLLYQRTPGGAGHFAYCCADVTGNTGLARRPGGVGEPDAVTLVETRGTGGQVVVAPTPPGIHPEHPERGYELVRGSWEALPIITPEERQALWNLARSFNTYVTQSQVHTPRATGRPGSNGTRPGDTLNDTADREWWQHLLERHGWTLVHQRGDVDYWRRPGKEGKEWSATLGACGSYFYVFSSNAAPFEPERAYKPFSAYALLEHHSDFAAAATALAKRSGMGTAKAPPQDASSRRNGQPPDEAPPADDLHDTRPVIRIGPDITRLVDEGQAALLALPHAPVIFQRARRLSIITRGVQSPRWLHRPADAPVIVEALDAYLDELATKAARWEKYDKRAKKGEEWVEVTPPTRFVKTLQARPWWPFPLLEGIIHSPTLRPDGSVLDTPGYDLDTALFFDSNGTTFPPLRRHPTLDDVRSAIGRLQEVVRDFPFAGKWHFSAWLSAVLSVVCRFTIMGCVPMHGITATTRGSGKSLLADTIALIGTGHAAARWSQVFDEDEERKRLLSLALDGDPLVCIDNVTAPLGSGVLALALTASSYKDRLLGVNQTKEAPLSVVLLCTGNNLQYVGDVARRVVPIAIDPQMERPEERAGFQHNPLLPWVQRERPRLTVAALTIVKAYFEAGCPAQGLTPLGSFEAWSDLIRQALVWAGEADPCEGRKDIEATSNPEYETLGALLYAWEGCYKDKPITLNAIIDDCQMYAQHTGPEIARNKWNELQDALGTCDQRYDGKRLDARKIGNALRGWQGRVIDRKRLIMDGKDRTNKTLWKVQSA